MVDRPVTTDVLTGLMFPMATFRNFTAKPNGKSADQRRQMGALSIALALKQKGELNEAIETLNRTLAEDPIESPESVAAIVANKLYFDVLAGRPGPGDPQFELSRILPKRIRMDDSVLSHVEAEPAYWLAVGEAASARGDDVAAGAFAKALELEPGLRTAVEGWIAAATASRAAANTSRAGDDGLRAGGEKSFSRDDVDRLRRHRMRLIESQELARGLVGLGYPEPEPTRRLIELLGELGRPVESACWTQWAMGRSPDQTQVAQYKRKAAVAEKTSEFRRRRLAGFDAKQIIPSSVVASPAKTLPAKTLPAESVTPENVAAETTASGTSRRTLADPKIPRFVDVADAWGVRIRHRNADPPVPRYFRLFEAFGSGVAVLDYDHDGVPDLFFGAAGGNPAGVMNSGASSGSFDPGQMFRVVNQPAMRSIAVGDSARVRSSGYTIGVTAGDLNGDGFEDLVVGNVGVNTVHINRGDGTFDRWDMPGEPRWTMAVAVADVTGDGLPELIEANYIDDEAAFDPVVLTADGRPERLPGPMHYRSAVDRIWTATNDGDWLPKDLGVDIDGGLRRTSFGLCVGPFDDQPGNDIFVPCDQTPNVLWSRRDDVLKPRRDDLLESRRDDRSDQTFRDIAPAMGLAVGPGGKPAACMGVAAADYDGDGRIDLHVTNFVDESSHHFLQIQPGRFRDLSAVLGIADVTTGTLGFGVAALDYDSNGSIDLIEANGHIDDFSDRNVAFAMPMKLLTRAPAKNPDERPTYRVATTQGDALFDTPRLARGIAAADFDDDGRVDLVITQLNAAAMILHNRTGATGGSTRNRSLHVRVVGVDSSRDAVGTRVDVMRTDAAVQTAFVTAGDGYACRSQSGVRFGIPASSGDDRGFDNSVVRLRITWPDGTVEMHDDVPADGSVIAVQGEPSVWTWDHQH